MVCFGVFHLRWNALTVATLSDILLYLSYFQEIAVLLKSWFDAGLSGLMITGARLDSINLQLTPTGFAHAWQTVHRHRYALRICLRWGYTMHGVP